MRHGPFKGVKSASGTGNKLLLRRKEESNGDWLCAGMVGLLYSSISCVANALYFEVWRIGCPLERHQVQLFELASRRCELVEQDVGLFGMIAR